jgi:precorrin-6B methylase 2
MIWIVLLVLFIFGFYTWRYKVPYLPTRRQEVIHIFHLSDLKPGESFMDLGSGDGKMLIEAERRGAKVFGVEANPLMWLWSVLKLRSFAKVKLGDFWKTDVGEADVVFVFLLPGLMKDVEDTLWPKMKKGARLVSNFFPLPTVPPSKTSEKVFCYIK